MPASCHATCNNGISACNTFIRPEDSIQPVGPNTTTSHPTPPNQQHPKRQHPQHTNNKPATHTTTPSQPSTHNNLPSPVQARPAQTNLGLPPRKDSAVLSIAAAWRARTATPRGRLPKTLVAVSGGADSTALLLAMTAIDHHALAVAHIIHDMRPPAQANDDAKHVAELCKQLNLPLFTAHASCKPQPNSRSTNAEANARRERYNQLALIANQQNIAYIATAHHADDQLETLIMALIRGAAHTGLRGIAPKRKLSTPSPPTHSLPHPQNSNQTQTHIHLIRPMLAVSRADAERICRSTNQDYRTDETNTDLSRTRAAIRAKIIPILNNIAPSAPKKAAETAAILRSVTRQIRADAAQLDKAARIKDQNPTTGWHAHAKDASMSSTTPGATGGLPDSAESISGAMAMAPHTHDQQHQPTPLVWSRQPLAAAEPAVLGQLLRDAIHNAAINQSPTPTTTSAPSLDRIPQRALTALHRAITDNIGGQRTFNLGPHQAQLTRQSLTLQPNHRPPTTQT